MIVELDTNTDEGRALAFALAEIRDDDALRSKIEAETRPPDFRLQNILIPKDYHSTVDWATKTEDYDVVALILRERRLIRGTSSQGGKDA